MGQILFKIIRNKIKEMGKIWQLAAALGATLLLASGLIIMGVILTSGDEN